MLKKKELRNINKYLVYIALISFGFYISCNYKQPNKKKAFKEYIISIQPFVDIPKSDVQYIAERLKMFYPNVKINNPIEFPKNSLNMAKTRYRADSLIRYLSRQTKVNDVIIGLTRKDISTTKGDKLDWGIMGLGYCPGNACVVSSFRLKGINKLEKLFKVSIHELGHTIGLNHCQIVTCLMRNADGKDHLNEMIDFCRACKQQLENAGLVFSKVN